MNYAREIDKKRSGAIGGVLVMLGLCALPVTVAWTGASAQDGVSAPRVEPAPAPLDRERRPGGMGCFGAHEGAGPRGEPEGAGADRANGGRVASATASDDAAGSRAGTCAETDRTAADYLGEEERNG